MQVQVSAKHKMLAVPFADSLNSLFPAARQIQFAGLPHMLLPHRATETFLLRRMGYEVPAPILTHYDWCGGNPTRLRGPMTPFNRRFVLPSTT
jgi:hypothetical protein